MKMEIFDEDKNVKNTCLRWTLNSKSKESAHASIKNSKDTKKLFCYLVSLAFDELSYHTKNHVNAQSFCNKGGKKGGKFPPHNYSFGQRFLFLPWRRLSHQL